MTVDVRVAYLALGDLAIELVGRAEVADRWAEPSVLAGMSIGGLTSHLTMVFTTATHHLGGDSAEDTGDSMRENTGADIADGARTVGAGEFFINAYATAAPDVDTLNAQILAQADRDATAGVDQTRRLLSETLAELHRRLPGEPPGRAITVFGGVAMTVDDYLITRVVEGVVHLDDLASSLGHPLELPPAAVDLAVVALTDIARGRHGDAAVVRALARAERAPEGVFPAI